MPPWGGRDLFRVHHAGHVALTATGRGGGLGQVGLQFGPEGPRSPAGARGAGGAGSGWGRVRGGWVGPGPPVLQQVGFGGRRGVCRLRLPFSKLASPLDAS